MLADSKGLPCNLGKILRTGRQDVIVEIVSRIVEGHAAWRVAVSVANKDKGARYNLQKRTEIFGDHHGDDVGADTFGTHRT